MSVVICHGAQHTWISVSTPLYEMWLRHLSSPFLFLSLYVYFSGIVNAYIRSSSPRFETFIRAENGIVVGLGKYLLHESERLEIIRNASGYEKEVPIVEKRVELLKDLYEKADANLSVVTEDIRQKRVQHPTSALNAVSNFLNNWLPLFSNETLYGFRLMEFLNVSRRDLVNHEDLPNICTELICIQFFFNLSSRDIFQGDILGVKGDPLTLQDAFQLGMTAKTTTRLLLAIEWFELVVNESRKRGNETDVNLPMVLSELALLYSHFGERDKAVASADEAYALNDTDNLIYKRFMQVQNEGVPPMKNFDEKAPDYWQNFTELCQANTTYQGPMKWYHRCRLRCSPIPIRRYREEIISIAPYVSVFYDLLSHDVIEDIKNSTAPNLSEEKHSLYGNFHSTEMLNQTTGSGQVLEYLAGEISGMDASYTPVSPAASPLRVIRFGFAGKAKPHLPYSMIDKRMYGAGYKIATVMFYLSDVNQGGATAFLDLGIRYQPKKGSALLMFLTKPRWEADTRLRKAECVHAVGSKWLVEKDIYFRRNKLARPCARSERGNEIGVERAVQKYRHCGF